jgi:hypothetical protein
MQEKFNTLRTGDADLRLYAYKQLKYPVPNVLRSDEVQGMAATIQCRIFGFEITVLEFTELLLLRTN